MNIFLGGVHGVGKTYLASRLPVSSGLLHTSASRLIRDEKAQANWSVDKRVSNIDENQVVLAKAVARLNSEGTVLLLDGHFVLLDKDQNFVPLAPDVFQKLNLSAVVLVECPLDVLTSRLNARDGVQWDAGMLERFMTEEREQARLVCNALSLPLLVFISSSDTEFAAAVLSLHQRK